MTERILVTGASGFVGRHLESALRRRLPEGSVVDAGRRIDDGRGVDVTDAAAVGRWVEQARPTALVHLAAVALPRDATKRPERAWAVNLTGTINVAQALRRHAPEARLLYVSSAEVYGRSFAERAGPIAEEALLKPLTVYGATKAAAEIAVGQMGRDGLRALILRPFNHTGPGQSPDYVIPSFATQLAEIEAGLRPARMTVGSLDVRRDMLDVRDVADAYAAACTMALPPPEERTVNIASGRAHRIGDLLDRLCGLCRVPVEVSVDPALVRPNEIPVVAGDGSRAGRWLDWSPRFDIGETLQAVLDDSRARVAARPR